LHNYNNRSLCLKKTFSFTTSTSKTVTLKSFPKQKMYSTRTVNSGAVSAKLKKIYENDFLVNAIAYYLACPPLIARKLTLCI